MAASGGSVVAVHPRERRRRMGLAPFAVLAVSRPAGDSGDSGAAAGSAGPPVAPVGQPTGGDAVAVDTGAVREAAVLTPLCALAGPILARLWAVDAALAAEARGGADRAKHEFLASVSHELRTPIHAVLGYAALLLDEVYGPLPARQRDKVERIRNAAQGLLDLVSDVLDLARIEAGRLPLQLSTTPLRPVLREVGLQAEAAARARGLAFAWELAPDLPAVHTDAGRLGKVLGNLLSNAVKFTVAGTVTLRAAREGDRVRIDVVDTGVGIPTASLDAIWQDFHQLDQSRTRTAGGTGLGLSIVRRLADKLDVELAVASEPGRGTTFTVRVPTAAGGA